MIQAFYQALQISVSLGKCIWIQSIKEDCRRVSFICCFAKVYAVELWLLRPSPLCPTPGSAPCGEVSGPVRMRLLAPAWMHKVQMR